MSNKVQNKQVKILIVSQRRSLDSYIKNSLTLLEKYYIVSVSTTTLGNLNLEEGKHQVVIFDNLNIDDVQRDTLRVNNKLNTKPFYIFYFNKISQEVIEVVFRKEFDYIVHPKFINSKNFTLMLVNIFRKYFESTMKEETLFINDLTINVSERKIWKENDLLRLTSIEFNLLLFFIKNEGKIISIQEIFKKIWETEDEDRTRIVPQYIHRLKTKIGKDYISTISSKGYIFSR